VEEETNASTETKAQKDAQPCQVKHDMTDDKRRKRFWLFHGPQNELIDLFGIGSRIVHIDGV